MPVLRPCSPSSLKSVLENAGYRLIDESEHNWVFALTDRDEPLILPKKGDDLALPILHRLAERTRGTSAEEVFRDTLIGTIYDTSEADELDSSP